jgi:hypothetical protein
MVLRFSFEVNIEDHDTTKPFVDPSKPYCHCHICPFCHNRSLTGQPAVKLVAVALMPLKSPQSKHGTCFPTSPHSVTLIGLHPGLVPHAAVSSGKLTAVCVRHCSRTQWLRFLTRVSGPVKPAQHARGGCFTCLCHRVHNGSSHIHPRNHVTK